MKKWHFALTSWPPVRDCARRLWPREVLAHLANFLALELPAHAFRDAPAIVNFYWAAFVVWAIGLYRNPTVVLRQLAILCVFHGISNKRPAMQADWLIGLHVCGQHRRIPTPAIDQLPR